MARFIEIAAPPKLAVILPSTMNGEVERMAHFDP
jgi:hypothetical protein